MSATVISVQNVSKCYRLGLIGGGTLRADFERWWARVRGKPDPLLKIGQENQGNREGEYIWALRDVSFEAKEGEVLGIIGRNGAGKSTLLKILSRVTAPTSGQAKITGRVASLLEVGTGFHPELTGRENIYLNGAILGMKKAEIERRFDEIVAFSEVEKFIDTPVKRYSSGMYVRLAFAVAAHLEPEILLVDEVLAVGDAAFQKKCLWKMGEIGKEGRTIIFVSHNMAAIRSLCMNTILLDNARVAAMGGTSAIVNHYLINKNVAGGGEVRIVPPSGVEIVFTRIWVTNANGAISSHLAVKEPFRICLAFVVSRPVDTAEISICLTNSFGVNVLFTSLSDCYDGRIVTFAKGKYVASVLINGNFLMPDDYLLRVSAHYRNVRDIDLHENILKLTIVETGSTMAPYGRAANYWSCVLGGTTWRLDEDLEAATEKHAKGHISKTN
jgi:lipopolysaccharide transport system ATP-binding protein